VRGGVTGPLLVVEGCGERITTIRCYTKDPSPFHGCLSPRCPSPTYPHLTSFGCGASVKREATNGGNMSERGERQVIRCQSTSQHFPSIPFGALREA